MRALIPPIKCQGIKSKLTPWIKECVHWDGNGRWIEPFLGSGVVGFNMRPKVAVFCDNNPHIINFYKSIYDGLITPGIAREFLESEGKKLQNNGKDYYYQVRERFNKNSEPLDFLFLNRSCFNGLIRFNGKGHFNVPFGHKPNRFSKAYITKITNQIRFVLKLAQVSEWLFSCQDFRKTLSTVTKNDIVYCDPPYAGRHVDYFNGWSDDDELALYQILKTCPTKFILSTWHSNQHRTNPYLSSLWSHFHVIRREHFYHVGAKETNRKPMTEALVLNFEPETTRDKMDVNAQQLALFESRSCISDGI